MRRVVVGLAVLAAGCAGTPLTHQNAANTDDWTICVIRGQQDRTGQEHWIADRELARRGVDCRELALLRAAIMPRYQTQPLQFYPMQVPQQPTVRPVPPSAGVIGILQGQSSGMSVTGVPIWTCRYSVQGSVRLITRAQAEGPCPPDASFY